MSKSKKIIAIVLALILAFSVMAVPASALSLDSLSNLGGGSLENILYMVLEKLMNIVLTFLNKYWPGYQDRWDTVEDYAAENFFPGEEKFETEIADGAQWKAGYSGDSLLTGLDILGGDFWLAGTLEPIAGRVPVEILDDQRVRVFALSDGVSGTVVYAAIDGFGFARGDVEEIRARFAEFAKKNDVISVNVSVLHQHSCIDTLGMNVPLVPALIVNTGNAAADGILDDYMITKNKEFMENLYNKTVNCMKKAVRNLKAGDLYYGSADITELVHDKREPSVAENEINRLRFVPEDGSAETWILEAAIHPTSFGAGPDFVTADFPYYVEKSINENDFANVVYIQGDELAITSDKSTTNVSDDRLENVTAYGNEIANRVRNISNEEKLDPVLNVAHREVELSVDNQILTLATREGIISAIIAKDGDGYVMKTEIGYMELGNNVAVFLVPGEADPVIFKGGATSADASWTGDTWDYAPLQEFTDCEHYMVCGLCNDQAGYILTDNEYHTLFTENEEVNIVSRTSGSTITNAFIELITDVKAA